MPETELSKNLNTEQQTEQKPKVDLDAMLKSGDRTARDRETARMNAKIDRLGREVVVLARNTLQVNMRFLDAALGCLKLEQYQGTMAVDGETLYYDPVYVLQRYRESRQMPARDYLHAVFHCVFHHAFVGKGMNVGLWNLACDMAAENAICDLNLKCTQTPKEEAQRKALKQYKQQVKHMTAEKIYHYLKENPPINAEYVELMGLFTNDDHTDWYAPEDDFDIESSVENDEDLESDGENDGEDEESETTREIEAEAELEEDYEETEDQDEDLRRKKIEKQWEDIAREMQTDLETFSKEMGDEAGGMMEGLRAVNREKYDYTQFLRRFSELGETVKINNDEFDYIFYTYGMKLYGRMPLIEPLEYKEDKKIREFVIAIDTSASVSGELVQKFVKKTYNILRERDNFFSKINLHIIQCDTKIQEDRKIETPEEFEEYMRTMQLKGFGGTDFRPVFEHVNDMVKKGEFKNLKGLIYFTDGYGTFPAHQPSYKSAFVFVDDDYQEPEVPVWAIRLVLQSEEIEALDDDDNVSYASSSRAQSKVAQA